MISFPPCKINLGLYVLERRADGFHNIETVFFPLPWTDILEVVPSEAFQFTATGIPIPGDYSSNLCVRAWQLLHEQHGAAPVHMHLHKIIPMGAGLGGGSSDGAHALRLVNQVCALELPEEQLRSYAASLGSDCAFFIGSGPMLGAGRGEILSQAAVNLKGCFLMVLKPEVSVPTAEAYRHVTPLTGRLSLTTLIGQPVENWRDHVVNDFETSVFRQYPAIAELKDALYAAGAVYASMSGSGAAVYALFREAVPVPARFTGLQGWSGWV